MRDERLCGQCWGGVGIRAASLERAHVHVANEDRFRSQMNTETRFVLVDAAPGLNRNATHEEISELAHGIYQEEGCPDGRAEEHWLMAEGFLKREMFTCE